MSDREILPLEMMARRDDWSEDVSLYMRQRTVGHGTTVATSIHMVHYEPGQIVKPILRLAIQQAQQLMDQLWQCGIRPTEGTGSAGALAATQKHLDDMRKIVFDEQKKHGS